MHKNNYQFVPCPTCCCEEADVNLLTVQKEIDSPLVQVCIEGQVSETCAIECRLIKTHMTTIEEMSRLQCCSLKLEQQLAQHIPNYLKKVSNKSHVCYSGPVRAKQASIQYDGCNGMTINYDFFYVASTNK